MRNPDESGAGGFEPSAATSLIVAPSTVQALLTGITAEDEARVSAYVARASAASTVRAYQSDWRLFT